MAVWTSEVAVCNGALSLLGAESITSLTDGSVQSNACQAFFEQARDVTLAAYPWNFATRRMNLGAVVATGAEGAPVFGWAYAHALPRSEDNYCLRVLDTKEGVQYRVERKWLYSDSTSVEIKYIYRVTSLAEWTPHAKLTLSAQLAMLIAYLITKSNTMYTTMYQTYKDLLADAQQVDTQEGTPDVIDSNEILDARYDYYPYSPGRN